VCVYFSVYCDKSYVLWYVTVTVKNSVYVLSYWMFQFSFYVFYLVMRYTTLWLAAEKPNDGARVCISCQPKFYEWQFADQRVSSFYHVVTPIMLPLAPPDSIHWLTRLQDVFTALLCLIRLASFLCRAVVIISWRFVFS